MQPRNYSIVVKNETAETKSNPVAGNATQPVQESGSGANVSQSIAKGLVSFKSFVQPFVEQITDSYVNTVSLRTGAEELQEKMQFARSVIKQGVGIAESITIGALTGGFVGAAVGAVMSIATTAVSYAIKDREIRLQRSVEDVSLASMIVRAGGSAAFSGSRERNQ
jgi:hypothetical protein